MIRVLHSTALRLPCGTSEEFTFGGGTVHELVSLLDARCPGCRDALVADGRLRPGVRVAIDGKLSPLGLHQKIEDSSEVVFLHAAFGG